MNTINLPPPTYRDELIELGVNLQPTHWVTLNLHRDATLEHATRCLKRWRVEILRRLCGRRFFYLPDEELIEFIGCPEFSLAGHPHFHLVCRVPATLSAKFESVAADRWKAIVPSATSHTEQIDRQPGSARRVMGYATKHLDASSPVPFVHSRLFH